MMMSPCLHPPTASSIFSWECTGLTWARSAAEVAVGSIAASFVSPGGGRLIQTYQGGELHQNVPVMR